MKKSKIIAFVLSCAMITANLPMVALAEEQTDADVPVEQTEEVEDESEDQDETCETEVPAEPETEAEDPEDSVIESEEPDEADPEVDDSETEDDVAVISNADLMNAPERDENGYMLLTGNETILEEGSYTIDHSVVFEGENAPLKLNGDVVIKIPDGMTLTIKNGLRGYVNSPDFFNLTIEGSTDLDDQDIGEIIFDGVYENRAVNVCNYTQMGGKVTILSDGGHIGVYVRETLALNNGILDIRCPNESGDTSVANTGVETNPLSGKVIINGGRFTTDANYIGIYANEVCNYGGDLTINNSEIGILCLDSQSAKVDLTGGTTIISHNADSGAGIVMGIPTVLTLGFCGKNDHIMIDSIDLYQVESSQIKVFIEDNKTLTDSQNNSYSGQITDINSICGKELLPGTIDYCDGDGVEQTLSINDFSVLSGSETILTAGWYVASASPVDMSYAGGLKIEGNVNIILENGCQLTVNGFYGDVWNDSDSCTLNIYAQDGNNESIGRLLVPGRETPHSGSVGIYTKSASVNGGRVTVTLCETGICANEGNITVNGGCGATELIVAATRDGVFISNNGDSLIVNGGHAEIRAYNPDDEEQRSVAGVSGNVTVSGGRLEVFATSDLIRTQTEGIEGILTQTDGVVYVSSESSCPMMATKGVYGARVSGGKLLISATNRYEGEPLPGMPSAVIGVNEGPFTVSGGEVNIRAASSDSDVQAISVLISHNNPMTVTGGSIDLDGIVARMEDPYDPGCEAVISFDSSSGFISIDGFGSYSNGMIIPMPGMEDTGSLTLTIPEGKALTGSNGETYFGKISEDTLVGLTDITFTQGLCPSVEVTTTGYNLILDGAVGVNYHVSMDYDTYEYFKDSNVVFTVNGQTQSVPVNGSALDEHGRIFRCNVAPKEMTDEVSASIVKPNGSSIDLGKFTIRGYAEHICKNEHAYANTALADLAASLLNYGAQAQIYFDHNTDDLANKNLVSGDCYYYRGRNVFPEPTTTDIPVYYEGSTDSGIVLTGYSVILNSNLSMKLYFDSDSYLAVSSVSCPSGSYRLEQIRDGKWALYIENIDIDDLAEAFRFDLHRGSGGHNEMRISPSLYLKTVLADSYQSSTTIKPFMTSLLAYYDCVKAYQQWQREHN